MAAQSAVVPSSAKAGSMSNNSCPRLLLCDGQGVQGLRVSVPGMKETDRYASLLECGGSRFMLNLEEPRCTRMRVLLSDRHFSSPRGVFGTCGQHHGYGRLTPNAAAACSADGQTLSVVGGQRMDFPDGNATPTSGVWLTSAKVEAATGGGSPAAAIPNDWSEPTLAADGDRAHCFEQRVPSKCASKDFHGHCEFDGRLSLIHHGGQMLLYARANLHPCGGGRHVQLARSDDGGATWSAFELVRIQRYELRQRSNIYFFHVQHSRTTGELVALYPAVIENGAGGAGVFASFSSDGAIWTAPEPLLRSATRFGDRVPDWPVGMVEGHLPTDQGEADTQQAGVQSTSSVHVFLQHDVRLGGVHGMPEQERERGRQTFLCRYKLPGGWLRWRKRREAAIAKDPAACRDHTTGETPVEKTARH